MLSTANFQRTSKAPKCRSGSNSDMLENVPEEDGFISRKIFDEACHALAQSSSDSRYSDMSLVPRGDVRSPCPLAFTLTLCPGQPAAEARPACYLSHAQVHLGRRPIPQDYMSSKHQSPSTNTIRFDEALLSCARSSHYPRIKQY